MSKGCKNTYKPDGSFFVLVGANKMEGGGTNNGTLWYMQSEYTHLHKQTHSSTYTYTQGMVKPLPQSWKSIFC